MLQGWPSQRNAIAAEVTAAEIGREVAMLGRMWRSCYVGEGCQGKGAMRTCPSIVRQHKENAGIVSTEIRDSMASVLVAGGFSVGLIGAVFYFFPAMIDRSKLGVRRAKLVADGGNVRRFDETWAAVDSRLPMYGRLSVFAGAFMIAAGAVVWFYASR